MLPRYLPELNRLRVSKGLFFVDRTSAAESCHNFPSSIRSRYHQTTPGPKGNRTAVTMNADAKKYISDSIRVVPDFPKKGIMFQDVTTLLLDPKAFKLSIDDLTERYKGKQIDVICGFEARGFLFGAPLALALDVPFVPLRKPGKLPGETLSAEYQLEYGSDKIEVHVGAVKQGQRVLLIDDLIATGGTLGAGISLMQKVGATVVEAACIIELPDLKGRDKLGGVPLYTQIEKEGD